MLYSIRFNFLVVISLLVLVLSCKGDEDAYVIPAHPSSVQLSESLFYEIDLNNRTNDTFKVRLYVDGLTASNSIFQFPATAPGTYDVMDIGRFVKQFNVYNKELQAMSVQNISTNQWEITNPEQAYVIEYEIAETWDTPVNENEIYRMGGTSMESDHVLLNTFCVLGYITGLKNKASLINIKHPDNWTVGTSLEKNSDNYYVASSYDYLVDSPMLLGELSYASTTVEGTSVGVYTYSASGVVQSDHIIYDVEGAINDAFEFLEGLPVDRYNFLLHYDDIPQGALEHSYSSVYVLEEMPFTSGSLNWALHHEFFHIVTPLNIHSQIIGDYNFVTPTPSEHLWLYEGVTEWASDLMQYRNNSMNISELFEQIQRKIEVNETYYDLTYSLSDIALGAYTIDGQEQFGNIYNRGALVALLLDIRLLELSEGERGLRELILELVAIYGVDSAFPEEQFFDILVAMTYPEINDFITSYIKGNEALPLLSYFEKIGILYETEEYNLSFMSNRTQSQQFLFNQWSINL